MTRWTEEQYQQFVKKKKGLPVKPQSKRKSKRKSKYNNQKTIVDGIKFDSKKEAEYYCQLKLLKQAGKIKDYRLQPRYELQPAFKKNGKKYRAITYIADFAIINNDGTTEVVDVKSSKTFKTQVYRIKKKMFEYKYPELTIKEVY
ncbi:MAG: DUF1064 domain-containing protein [Tissierellia bacterium]|nr:DUF1064 domain-containing protein [Tissierellia bacterium]